MALKLTNNAVAILAANVSTSDTIIAVTPGAGVAFPAVGAGDWAPLTLVKSNGDFEIVRLTGRSGDAFTVERAQEGTSATEFTAGDRVEHRLTAGALQYMIDQIDHALPKIGDIKIWQGSVNDIQTVHGPGWYLADGQNGTIDLRDKFIVAAGGAYSPGDTGGAASITLLAANMPAHSHSFSGATAFGGGHAHTASSSAAGSHNHSYVRVSGTTNVAGPGAAGVYAAGGTVSSDTGNAGNHNHPITVNAGGDHQHTFSGTTGSAGSGQAFDNRPPYYALAFIQYVGV